MSHMSLLQDLTKEERKHVIALDYVILNLMADIEIDEILPKAKEILDFIDTGDYEEAEAEIVELNLVKE